MHQSERSKKRPAPSVHLDFPYYRGKHSEHPPGPGGSAGGGQSRRVRTLPGGGPGEAFLGGVQKSRFLTPPGGVGGEPPPGGHFPLPKIRPQPERRTGKKPTKLYSTKCRPKTAFLTPPEGGVTPGGVTVGLRPPRPDPPAAGPPVGPPGTPREGGVRPPPSGGGSGTPPRPGRSPERTGGGPPARGCRAGAPDPIATWPPSS